MFVIVESWPVHCAITDGIIGSSSRIVEAGIMTEAWARKRAGILENEAYGHCSDSAFYARDAADPFNRNRPPFRSFPVDVDAFDEIPF